MATTISGPAVTNDTGTVQNPNEDGTALNQSFFNSLYAAINAMWSGATQVFDGVLSVTSRGSHTFSAGGAGANTIIVRNTAAGTGNRGSLELGNDTDADLGRLEAHSSTYNTAPYGTTYQNGVLLRAMGAGGLVLAAEDASGTVALYAGGTTAVGTFDGDRLTFSAGTPGTYVAGGVLTSSVDTSDAANVSSTETDLHSYTLPGGTLGTDGQAIRVTAAFETAANGNSKRFRLYFGSTVIYDSTSWGANAQDGVVTSVVIRTGATTQRAGGMGYRNGSGEPISTYAAPAETLSGNVTIKSTGQGSASSDITARFFMVELIH